MRPLPASASCDRTQFLVSGCAHRNWNHVSTIGELWRSWNINHFKSSPSKKFKLEGTVSPETKCTVRGSGCYISLWAVSGWGRLWHRGMVYLWWVQLSEKKSSDSPVLPNSLSFWEVWNIRQGNSALCHVTKHRHFFKHMIFDPMYVTVYRIYRISYMHPLIFHNRQWLQWANFLKRGLSLYSLLWQYW